MYIQYILYIVGNQGSESAPTIAWALSRCTKQEGTDPWYMGELEA